MCCRSGVTAAAVLAGRDPELERDALLQLSAGMEGHADNAAASLLGGFVVAWEAAGSARRCSRRCSAGCC